MISLMMFEAAVFNLFHGSINVSNQLRLRSWFFAGLLFPLVGLELRIKQNAAVTYKPLLLNAS